MKCNCILLSGLLCLLPCAVAWAQQTRLPLHQKKTDKPLLFAALPERFECDAAEISALFSREINERFSTSLSDRLLLEGLVIDKMLDNRGVLSVNIRLQNYDNALFNLTLRLQANNTASIQGRILHPRYGDALMLTKENNTFYLYKRDQRLVMPE
ncbi:MAG TPA: hypothetical protein PK339_12225 [Flavitalea sp.]|nr:hypothetical protein [Flavitalea sp.]